MATIDYCSVALGEHERVQCADYPKGGAPVIALMEQDHSITCYETKGHWEDDARVKIKTAAAIWSMFHFVAVTEDRSGPGLVWKQEPIICR